MRYFKVIVEYEGTKFSGWQIQYEKRTVQGEIQDALRKIFKKSVRVMGSGRTDTGVHALGQVARFEVPTKLTSDAIQKALNYYLPKDIAVLDLYEASSDFHPRYGSKSKIYRYRISNDKCRSALDRNFSWYVPHKIDVPLMSREAKDMIGEKNFRGFTSSDPSQDMAAKNTVRKIKRIDIRREGNNIVIEIEANGFLYKMARTMVSTLVNIGTGKLAKGTIKKILKSKDRRMAPAPAPAHGLYLYKVKY